MASRILAGSQVWGLGVALAGAIVTLFPPAATTGKLAWLLLFMLASVGLAISAWRESSAADTKLTDINSQLAAFGLQLDTRNALLLRTNEIVSKAGHPAVGINYFYDLENGDDHPFVVHNMGLAPALHVTIGDVRIRDWRVYFKDDPRLQNLPPNARVEIEPVAEQPGLRRIAPAYHFWEMVDDRLFEPPGAGRASIGIDEAPLTYPFSVSYYDPTGREFKTNYELVVNCSGRTVFTRMSTVSGQEKPNVLPRPANSA
jgi:hypothetical protein